MIICEIESSKLWRKIQRKKGVKETMNKIVNEYLLQYARNNGARMEREPKEVME